MSKEVDWGQRPLEPGPVKIGPPRIVRVTLTLVPLDEHEQGHAHVIDVGTRVVMGLGYMAVVSSVGRPEPVPTPEGG